MTEPVRCFSLYTLTWQVHFPVEVFGGLLAEVAFLEVLRLHLQRAPVHAHRQFRRAVPPHVEPQLKQSGLIR